ncbi:Uncharacterised protein [Escherichia coli]|uniref:Uncharacterized protein n=1 Tax=Escherichia coli TaxID=562 RepID=A0A2X1MX46_ECOLX|nr:Uncharacterised protein [Escherichia coli]STI36818.1 Uncharacterised protein [Escherichia coli]
MRAIGKLPKGVFDTGIYRNDATGGGAAVGKRLPVAA